MSDIIKYHKVVSSLPGTLESNSVYYVRVGSGYDMYVTNDAGVVASYQLNLPNLNSLNASNLTSGTVPEARLAGTYEIDITGNATWAATAGAATKLATARTINGVAFDGTANITIADNTKLAVGGTAVAATKLATARTINGVAFDGTVNITIADSTKLAVGGTAVAATKLATARTINGVAFDGTANITIPSDFSGISLPINTDLDTISTPGKYYCPANATVVTFTNCPTGNAFTMDVSKHAGFRQELSEYIPGSTAKSWYRNSYTGAFGNWYRLYSENDPQPNATDDTKLPLTGGVISGNIQVQPGGNTTLELGRMDGFASTSVIDFHSGATPVDYDGRIQATAGNGSIGGGNLSYIAASHTISGTVYMNGWWQPAGTGYRSSGMYGTYDSTKIGHVWSMGTAYRIPDDGANFGSTYGMAYKHTNNTTGGNMAGGHQILFCSAGTPGCAVGLAGNFWTSGTYYGSGAGLTSLPAGQLSGIVPNASLFDGGWVGLALVNSFTTTSGGVSLRYRRVGNVVYVTGQLSRSSSPSALMNIATLPAGFRPDVNVVCTNSSGTTSPSQNQSQDYIINTAGVMAVGGVTAVGTGWTGSITMSYPVP